VPQSYSLDPQLGLWVAQQHVVFKKGRMDFERKDKLDVIGFEFSVKNKADEEKRTLQFKKLQDYYGKQGDCDFCVGLPTVFPSSLNTPTNSLPASLPALQVKCRSVTA
jgi:hypothetical protein